MPLCIDFVCWLLFINLGFIFCLLLVCINDTDRLFFGDPCFVEPIDVLFVEWQLFGNMWYALHIFWALAYGVHSIGVSLCDLNSLYFQYNMCKKEQRKNEIVSQNSYSDCTLVLLIQPFSSSLNLELFESVTQCFLNLWMCISKASFSLSFDASKKHHTHFLKTQHCIGDIFIKTFEI